MSEDAVIERLNVLTDMMETVLRRQGDRLTRSQMLERFDVCNKTLNKRIAEGTLPKPMADGKWLLADVMAHETSRY